MTVEDAIVTSSWWRVQVLTEASVQPPRWKRKPPVSALCVAAVVAGDGNVELQERVGVGRADEEPEARVNGS
jgi:hypothetical protein